MKNIIAEEIDRQVEDKVKLAKQHGLDMSNFLDSLMNNDTFMSAEDLDIAEYSFKLARLEMKERVAKAIGDISKDMWLCTFHTACVRILRSHIRLLGFEPSFVILTLSD